MCFLFYFPVIVSKEHKYLARHDSSTLGLDKQSFCLRHDINYVLITDFLVCSGITSGLASSWNLEWLETQQIIRKRTRESNGV